jgi:glycerate kinase
MRILVSPQEFKGSLTATEAARVIAAGVRDVLSSAEIDAAPMSDGGPGLVEAMLAGRGGQRLIASAHDALGRPLDAAWALLGDGTAVVEMAAASGLVLIAEGERDPMHASTYGTGELVRAALDRGAREVIVGVGGSATTDAGAGAMLALGARLLDGSGVELPPGGAALARLARIDLRERDQRLAATRLRVAADVTSTLCGASGAALVFSPQKGATPAQAQELERALRRFAEVAESQCGVDVLGIAGGGAAGGLGAGLVVLAGATVEPGAPLVGEAIGLPGRVASADLVITGEGRLDAQTAQGKTASYVAKLARQHGTRVVAVAGSIGESAPDIFDDLATAARPEMPAAEAMRDAPTLVRRAAAELMRRACA